VRPLLPEAGGTIVAVERWGPSAIERKLVALERRRAKLVPMLAMHRMSAARRARLRQQLANADEMIWHPLHYPSDEVELAVARTQPQGSGGSTGD